MEKIATDIYSFRKLRDLGFTYVDKTAMLLPLCDQSLGSQFFLARPRRFGKSLLVEFKLDRPDEEALAQIDVRKAS